jgi:hypothetical protein
MSLLALLLAIFYMVSHVNGRGGHASWINAHATFYGGSDASGTMGMHTYMNVTDISTMSTNILTNLE